MASKPQLVTVFGGSGFVGRHVVGVLARKGYQVRVACRRPDLAFHLQPLGNVGQIALVQANLRYRWSVDRALEGADHAVNLVAILHETGRQKFASVQEFGARAVAEAARAAGASLTHVSAIGADAASPSAYARTKAAAELAVLETVKSAIILRPSLVFGPEDRFFNRFANMARFTPALPLIGADTLFQPVFVGDVAQAVAVSVAGGATPGKTYELGGPDQRSFRAWMELMLEVIGRERMLANIPFWMAKIQGSLLGMLPNPLLTADQVELLKIDNVVSKQAVKERRTLEGLGIAPSAAEAILPSYLSRFRVAGQFTRNASA